VLEPTVTEVRKYRPQLFQTVRAEAAAAAEANVFDFSDGIVTDVYRVPALLKTPYSAHV